MEPIGERLKKIRLEKGLSLAQIHRKTRIHPSILEALEEGRLINKSPVYIHGFLKIYCKALGLKPEDFLGGLEKPEAKTDYLKVYQKAILPKPSVRLARFWPHFHLFKALLIALCVFILGLGVVKLTKAYKRHAASVAAKKAKKEFAQKPIPSETLRLSIRARDNCWIKAKVDGKVLFADVLKKGRFESWQAKEKIELSLGNAGGVELQLNGKLISSLGRKGQVIKQILISKEEGLKIIK